MKTYLLPLFVLCMSVHIAPKTHAADGPTLFNKCKACHTIENGGPNRVGPNLFGIVSKGAATNATFKYSPAFVALKGKKTWSEAELNTYLKNPKAAVPGTRMVFAGLPSDTDRATLVAWLKTQK